MATPCHRTQTYTQSHIKLATPKIPDYKHRFIIIHTKKKKKTLYQTYFDTKLKSENTYRFINDPTQNPHLRPKKKKKNHQILITLRKPSPKFTKTQTNKERGGGPAATNGGIAGVICHLWQWQSLWVSAKHSTFGTQPKQKHKNKLFLTLLRNTKASVGSSQSEPSTRNNSNSGEEKLKNPQPTIFMALIRERVQDLNSKTWVWPWPKVERGSLQSPTAAGEREERGKQV